MSKDRQPIRISRREFLKISGLAGAGALLALETGCSPNPYENLEGVDISECLIGNVRINLNNAIVSVAPTSGPEAFKADDLVGVRREQARSSGMPNIYNRDTGTVTHPARGKIVRVNNTDIAHWGFLTNHLWEPEYIHGEFVIKNPAIVDSKAGTPEAITYGWNSSSTVGEPEIDYSQKIPNKWAVLNTEVSVLDGFGDKMVRKIFYVYLGPQRYADFERYETIKFVDSDNRELTTLPPLVRINKNPRGEYISQQDGQPIKDFGAITVINNTF